MRIHFIHCHCAEISMHEPPFPWVFITSLLSSSRVVQPDPLHTMTSASILVQLLMS